MRVRGGGLFCWARASWDKAGGGEAAYGIRPVVKVEYG